MLPKLPRATLAEQAARNLMAFIESQRLMPGSLLPPENRLAADMGVSRPIIREALKSLEGKGIIEVVSGKGAIVKSLDSQPLQLFFQRAIQIDSEAIIDLLELRRCLEIESAALAAQHRTSEELVQLGEIVVQMRENLHVPDRYVELDIAFHQQIAAMTRNTMIYWLVGAVRAALKDTLQESVLRQQRDDQFEHVQVGHEAILRSLESGDAVAAERAMTAHFEDAVISLLRSAASETTPLPPKRVEE